MGGGVLPRQSAQRSTKRCTAGTLLWNTRHWYSRLVCFLLTFGGAKKVNLEAPIVQAAQALDRNELAQLRSLQPLRSTNSLARGSRDPAPGAAPPVGQLPGQGHPLMMESPPFRLPSPPTPPSPLAGYATPRPRSLGGPAARPHRKPARKPRSKLASRPASQLTNRLRPQSFFAGLMQSMLHHMVQSTLPTQRGRQPLAIGFSPPAAPRAFEEPAVPGADMPGCEFHVWALQVAVSGGEARSTAGAPVRDGLRRLEG